ncbi:hypothetical protein VTN02DRAFT_6237 [Thermoascus thermophilus]
MRSASTLSRPDTRHLRLVLSGLSPMNPPARFADVCLRRFHYPRRLLSTSTSTPARMANAPSTTPVEDAIREKGSNNHPFSSRHTRCLSTETDPSTADSRLLALDADHPQRLAPARAPRAHAGQCLEGDAFPVRPLGVQSSQVQSSDGCHSVTITSSAFQAKPQPARHRMVYALLKEEMAREGGIHALQLRTRTPEEERQAQQEEQPQ